jgi:hypothetical protein
MYGEHALLVTACRVNLCDAGMSVPGWIPSVSVLAIVVAACGQTRRLGAPCAGEDTLVLACKGSALVSCREFTWHEDLCRGPRGCLDKGCDQSVAEPGDSCATAGALACAVDGKELLRCDAGAMVVAQECRGARGCYEGADGSSPACDVGEPEVGDACEASGFRCGSDGKTVLACTSHHYAVRNRCLGDKGCFTFSPSVLAEQRRNKDCFAGFLACDPSVGEVGEPCGGAPEWGRPCLSGDHCPKGTTRTKDSYSRDGWSFCSKDGKEELGCKDGRLVAVRSCSLCTVEWGADEEHYTVDCAHQKSGGGTVGVFRPEDS